VQVLHGAQRIAGDVVERAASRDESCLRRAERPCVQLTLSAARLSHAHLPDCTRSCGAPPPSARARRIARCRSPPRAAPH
jgi:Tfp pilus assembly protein PilX